MNDRVSVSAPLRICLCGEDLDWLGYRCIAAAIKIRLTVSLADGAGAEFFDSRILDNVWELTAPTGPALPPQRRPSVRVEADGPLASGLGSSSATALAAARIFHFVRSPEQSRGEASRVKRAAAVAAAFEAERRVTNGGGMDHVAIASGGVVLLQGTRDRKPPGVLGRIADPRGLALVVIDTGSRKVSGTHLARIRRRDAENCPNQQLYCRVCDDLSERVWSALVEGRRMRLAAAVNSAHEAMRDLQDMSTPLIEHVRTAALAAGFPGVKISGSGGGGCLVAVTDWPDVDAQLAAFERATSHLVPTPMAVPVGVQPREWDPWW